MVASEPIKEIPKEAVVPVVKPEKTAKVAKSKVSFEDKIRGSKIMELLYKTINTT